MQAYHDMLRFILENGEDRGDRTGVGTRSVFGYQARYVNVGENFPLDTSRKLNFQQIIGELLWMLRGNTNIQELAKQGFYLWADWPLKNYNINNPDAQMSRNEFNEHISTNDAFAEKWGDCGPVYGKQWRNWTGCKQEIAGNGWQNVTFSQVDQIAMLVEDLKKNPLSRRHIVSAWNVADIPAMIPSGLPPCHVMFQFYCSQLSLRQRLAAETDFEIKTIGFPFKLHEFERGNITERDITKEEMNIFTKRLDTAGYPKYKLHCQLCQRSLDSVLGAPYNIASYSLLTMMLAQQCNMVSGDFIHAIGDAHIYSNHMDSLRKQLEREPRPAPTVWIKKAADITSYTIDDFELVGYNPHPAISYPIAV
jgi:thymidylate synthase